MLFLCLRSPHSFRFSSRAHMATHEIALNSNFKRRTTEREDSKLLPLVIGALGVVYGDIGTSPLYTIRECFYGSHAIALTQENILGVMSIAFWSMAIVVTLKYLTFILLADNHGEGGIFALLGLVTAESPRFSSRSRQTIIVAGILGAGLLYGEGIITPAISVLSAVEGLEHATKAAQPIILPATCLILFLLFLFQRRGTADIGRIFGPIMAIWFISIAAFGLGEIFESPQILEAVNPIHALHFFSRNRFGSIIVFGSIVLCLTGSEALYADLGHFGRKPIRLSWFTSVFPALMCNYFGQSALLLSHPEMRTNPFYALVPASLLYPMIVLSTVATIIASQALISGVFSLTQQAIDLGFCPRFLIVHTSSHIKGQIYIPVVNYFLMFACLGVVIGFRQSTHLAGAYGISVTGTMVITSFLFFLLARRKWDWPLWKALPLVALFLIFELSYFGANLLKFVDGGWFSVTTAAMLVVIMTTWRKGRAELVKKMGSRLPLKAFLEDVVRHNVPRVKGTAVFMSVNPEGTSPVLLHPLNHTKVLYERVVLLTILWSNIPYVQKNRVTIENLGMGFYRIIARNGYMQRPNVPQILKSASSLGLDINPMETTFILGRITLFISGDSKMMRWRKALFALMTRISGTPTAYFGLPPNRVMEVGAHIQL